MIQFRLQHCAMRMAYGVSKGDVPFCSMGVFSGGVPLRQENALLSYGFSVQNSHWSRNHIIFSRLCLSFEVERFAEQTVLGVLSVWISLRTDSRSSRCTRHTDVMRLSLDSRGHFL